MPPSRAKKRKVASLPSNVPVSLKKRPRASSQSASRAMENWLEQLTEVEVSSTTAHLTSLCRSIRSSPLLVQAMVQCQERFVQLIAAQLATDASSRDGANIRRLGESQVHAAMQTLGMADILTEAQRLQQAMAPKEKLPKRKKQPQWSGEEIAEQERLLASSKEKMLGTL